MTYKIHEIVRSLQGEGARMGIPTTFLRFSGCNLKCTFCDTKAHKAGADMTLDEIVAEVRRLGADVVSLCGGEPTLQVDDALINALKGAGSFLSIETNGTNPVPRGVDYIVVSPKVPDGRLARNFDYPGAAIVDELKYVLDTCAIALPDPPIPARNYFISPIYDGEAPIAENIAHCAKLVLENPTWRPWRLTAQAHKLWGVI